MTDDEYARKASEEIARWRGKKPPRVITAMSKPSEFVGYPIKKILETERGAKIVTDVVETLFDGGTWKFDAEVVLERYRDGGFDVHRLEDVLRVVPLRVIDEEANRQWARATITLTAEGAVVGPAMAAAATAAGAAAAASAAASGGTMGPAAGAAGLAVVGTAAVAETTFLIGYCCRRLATIAACYGYDVRDESERAFALQVFTVATAESLEAKQTALIDLGQLAGRLGLQRQPWAKLEQSSVIARTVRELAQKLGVKLTQAQLRRVLTVVGAALGAGFNGHLGHATTKAAYHLYRERALAEPDTVDVPAAVGDITTMQCRRCGVFIPAAPGLELGRRASTFESLVFRCSCGVGYSNAREEEARRLIYSTPKLAVPEAVHDGLDDTLAAAVNVQARTGKHWKFCSETSEDAATWTVFRALEARDELGKVGSGSGAARMLLWGVPTSPAADEVAAVLASISNDLGERAASRSEPDVIVAFDDLVVVCEAKLGSRNDRQTNRLDRFDRYLASPDLWRSTPEAVKASGLYELTRNWAIAAALGDRLGVPALLVNLAPAGLGPEVATFRSLIAEHPDRTFAHLRWGALLPEDAPDWLNSYAQHHGLREL
jgi:hypothetical protein